MRSRPTSVKGCTIFVICCLRSALGRSRKSFIEPGFLRSKKLKSQNDIDKGLEIQPNAHPFRIRERSQERQHRECCRFPRCYCGLTTVREDTLQVSKRAVAPET